MRVSAAGNMPLQGLVKPPAKPVVMICGDSLMGVHDHGTGERGAESSVPKRMARIASMAILGSRRMDSKPFVSCMTSVNCV